MHNFENESFFPDYISEIVNVSPDKPVTQMMRMIHLAKLSNLTHFSVSPRKEYCVQVVAFKQINAGLLVLVCVCNV